MLNDTAVSSSLSIISHFSTLLSSYFRSCKVLLLPTIRKELEFVEDMRIDGSVPFSYCFLISELLNRQLSNCINEKNLRCIAVELSKGLYIKFSLNVIFSFSAFNQFQLLLVDYRVSNYRLNSLKYPHFKIKTEFPLLTFNEAKAISFTVFCEFCLKIFFLIFKGVRNI